MHWDAFIGTWGLLVSYGLSVLPLSYLYSFAFDGPSTAQISIAGINFLTGFGFVVSYAVLVRNDLSQLVNQSECFVEFWIENRESWLAVGRNSVSLRLLVVVYDIGNMRITPQEFPIISEWKPVDGQNGSLEHTARPYAPNPPSKSCLPVSRYMHWSGSFYRWFGLVCLINVSAIWRI